MRSRNMSGDIEHSRNSTQGRCKRGVQVYTASSQARVWQLVKMYFDPIQTAQHMSESTRRSTVTPVTRTHGIHSKNSGFAEQSTDATENRDAGGLPIPVCAYGLTTSSHCECQRMRTATATHTSISSSRKMPKLLKSFSSGTHAVMIVSRSPCSTHMLLA